MLRRLALNLFAGWFRLSRWFPAPTLRRIRLAISQGERSHAGEICFVVEARYPFWAVLKGLEPRDRAHQVFALLRVWDTHDNSGVLVYLQLAERRVELVADRGIAARVSAADWQSLCDRFADDISHGPADDAVLACIAKINVLLTTHFPAGPDNPRELSDEPVVL